MMSAPVVPAAPRDHSNQAPRFLPLETIEVRLYAPPHTDRRRVFGIISNISETGGCIITNVPLPVGIEVGLTIESRRREMPLEVSARIVWCAERFEPVKEIVGFLTGVSFEPSEVDSVRDLVGSGLFQVIP